MAKRSQRRAVRYEKDQLGCMWGLISIFDFRNGRSTQKLLSDRRRANRHENGAGNQRNKPELSTLNENCQQDGEESRTVASNAGKPSVKKLMEEEMICEQNSNKEINDVEGEPKGLNSEQRSYRKKTRKRMKRNQKKSCDSIHDLDSNGSLRSEQPCHQDSEYEFISSLDMDNIMEEYCHQMHQKSIDYAKHDQACEIHVQSNLKNPDFEEKLKEAIKLLISQKLIKGKHSTEDGEFQPSKELMDALQILGSDRELFVKHLQDPNSPLVKSIQNYPDEQLEKDEGNSKSLSETNSLDLELGNLRHSDELANRKQRRFLRRTIKSQGKSASNADKTLQASNRIVILKPGLTGLQNQETASSIGLSPESHYLIRNKVSSERNGSHFFLTEIKRKLKNAMGKEHQRICTDGSSKGSSYECQNVGDRDRGIKNIGMSSPTKDHFFMEKIARPFSFKKGDKTGKLKGDELNTEHKTADFPKQKGSNIYLEAKKHLSEMLSNGDENLVSSSGRVPRTLGRILSLPEYNFSPVGSPVRNWDPSFVTAQMRFIDSDKSQKVNENAPSLKQGSHINHLGQLTESLVTQPCISDDGTGNKGEAPNLNSNILNEEIHNIDVEKISSSVGDEMSSKDGIVVEEENNVLDAPCEPSSSSSIKDDDKNGDESEIFYGQRDSKFMKQDSSVENQLPSSPSNSSIPKKVEDREIAIDILERPSPVSVLEPLFTEDDISPARTRYNSGEKPLQPLRIKFEDHDPSTADQNIQVKSSTEDKESIYKHVKAVLQTSGLNWDELCIKLLSTDQLIDPSLSGEVEFLPSKICYEQKLLFDCINEILMEVCGHYFGCSPWVSFAKPYIRPVPNMENVLGEVWQGVLWHLLPLPIPPTLDQTVRKDMAKSGTWMDLRYDTDTFGIEMGEAILEDLMEDTIISCVNGSPELGCPAISVESNGKEEQHLLEN